MRVKFWGVRGSVPTPGRATEKYGGNTTCVEVQADGQRVILDGGTGIRELGLAMNAEGPSEAIILFSHFHWDHIQGIPFFIPFFRKGYRFRIFAPGAHQARIEGILYKQMEADVFPVDFDNLSAEIVFEHLPPGGVEVGGLRLSSFPLVHPGGCEGYRIESPEKTVIFATDNEIDSVLDTPDYDAMVKEVKGADLFIADGQYEKADFPTKNGWGHSSVEEVIVMSNRAGVKRVAVTHHDPMQTDIILSEKERKARADAEDIDLFFGRDGLAVQA